MIPGTLVFLLIGTAGFARAAAPALAKAEVAASTAAPTVATVYAGDRLRDPFQPPMAASGGGSSNKPFTPEDFSIHNLSLRGLMKDSSADYALFADQGFNVSFILRKGRLYDFKGKPVARVTGSLNVRKKTAHLMTPEGDVQTFRLGDEEKD